MNSLPFEITPNLMFVGGLATGAAASAVGVVVFRDTIRAALSLVINFLLLAVLYFTMEAEMIGITQIVVYTGAIMVLFLFVIMLLNMGAPQLLSEKKDPKVLLGLGGGLSAFALMGGGLLTKLIEIKGPANVPKYGAPDNLGAALFTVYTWPFEIASILLVVGIVGSIILAKRRIS